MSYDFLEEKQTYLKKEKFEFKTRYYFKKGDSPIYYLHVYHDSLGWDIEGDIISDLHKAESWFKEIFREATFYQFKKDRVRRLLSRKQIKISDILYYHYVLEEGENSSFDYARNLANKLSDGLKVFFPNKRKAYEVFYALKEERYAVDIEEKLEGCYLKLKNEETLLH